MKYMIYDETDDRFVNESEAYDEIEEYGNSDAPSWCGSAYEARMIADRLEKGTGHRFTVRRD